MKKNGFTLIEILAVITLIAALSLILVPTIVNQVNKSKGTIDKATTDLITQSAYTYIDMNQTKYPMKEGNTYCITLQTLVDYGFLKGPVQNSTSGTDIPLNRMVKSVFTSDLDIDYTITDTCTEVRK